MAMGRLLPLWAFLAFTAIASPGRAADAGQPGDDCYWCTQDAIYQRVKLISGLEANPDIDEGVKGPQITAARAEIHSLRATLDSPQRQWLTPCCYARKPLYIR